MDSGGGERSPGVVALDMAPGLGGKSSGGLPCSAWPMAAFAAVAAAPDGGGENCSEGSKFAP